MTWASEVAADSPLLWLRHGETSGTTMLDSSGAGHNGTYTSAPNRVAGLTGDGDGAIFFTGSQSGTVPFGSWQNVGQITVKYLVTVPAMTTFAVNMITRDAESGTTNRAFGLRINRTRQVEFTFYLAASVGTVRTVTGSTLLVAGQTYDLSATYDGTTANVLVNGVVDGSLSISGSLALPTSQAMLVGTDSGGAGRFLNGVLDEGLVYGTALTPTRLAAHAAAAGLPSPTPTREVLSRASLDALLQVAPSIEVSRVVLEAVIKTGTPIEVVVGGRAVSATTARSGVVLAQSPQVVTSGRATESATATGGATLTPTASVILAGRATETNTVFPRMLPDFASTDTANYGNGRSRSGSGEDFTLYPVPPLPFHLSTEPRRIMAQQMPRPTLVNGRPT